MNGCIFGCLRIRRGQHALAEERVRDDEPTDLESAWAQSIIQLPFVEAGVPGDRIGVTVPALSQQSTATARGVLTRDPMTMVLSKLSHQDLLKWAQVNTGYRQLARLELETRFRQLAVTQWEQYFTKLDFEGATIDKPHPPPKEMDNVLLAQLLSSPESKSGPVVQWIPKNVLLPNDDGETEKRPFNLLTIQELANKQGKETPNSIWIDKAVKDQLGTETAGEGRWVWAERMPEDSLNKNYNDLAKEIGESGKQLLSPIEAIAIQHQRWVLYQDDIFGKQERFDHGNYTLCDRKVTVEGSDRQLWVIAGGRRGASGFEVNYTLWHDHSQNVGAASARKF